MININKFSKAALAATTALGASLFFAACGDDSSSGVSNEVKMTVKDLVDSIVCNNDGEASVKTVNDSTYKIMCGKDSVGFASTGEFTVCALDVHKDKLGFDVVCDDDVVGAINLKIASSSSSKKDEEATSSSSEKADGKSSSSEKGVSSSSAKSSSSEGGEKPESSSSEKTDGKSSSSEKADDKSSSSETCELIELPEPIAFAQKYVDCKASYSKIQGEEYWDVNVPPVSADSADYLYHIGYKGNGSFDVLYDLTWHKDGKYKAHGSKIARDGFMYIVDLLLVMKDDGRYSGDLEFTRRAVRCEEVVKKYPNEFVCVNGVLTDIADADYCGNYVYNKTTHFCQDESSVYPLCGGKSYEMDEFCFEDKVYSTDDAERCGDGLIIYDDNQTQICDDGEIVTAAQCGNTDYNPNKQFCDTRDNQVYGFVKIGDQVWMSENLNYYDEENPNFVLTYNGKVVDELTHCGGKNCNVYGRLYTWTTAMDIDAYDYMTGREVYADTVAHQGICPEGWHIPRMSEAEPLIASVKSGKQLCKDYGASKYETCDNETGFSAVGAGVYREGATAAEDPYKAVDESAAFWLANNKLATGGTTKFLASDFYIQMPWGVLQSEDDGYHTDGLSVRCVKD